MAMTLKIVDKGMDSFLKEIMELEKNPSVKIGVMQEEASRSDELDNVSLMSIHEFGSSDGKIPQRSIIREGTDSNVDNAFALEVKEYDKTIRGKSTINKMVQKTGVFMEGEFKRRFNKKYLTPNAPETIRKKKSDTPLIDTGQLRQSIKSKVK